MIDKLILKHQIERNNLKVKLDNEINKLHNQRKVGLDIINHKFRNKKQNMEIQQCNEKNLVSNTNLQRASKYKLLYCRE